MAAATATLNLPRVIGHRGAAAHAPENTLAGFRAARALRCTWVEFDVRLTADDMPVVCHDDKLNRTTGALGNILRLPHRAIRDLDAGSWFGPGFTGERIPTLTEVITLCGELGLGANVEIKAERGRGPATAAAVAACLDGIAISAPVLISSFHADALAEAASSAPSVPRGMLFRRMPHNWHRIAASLACTTIHASRDALSTAMAAQVLAEGYPLLVYTVNDPARARQLFDWGVASVFSDAPDIIGAAAADWANARRGALL